MKKDFWLFCCIVLTICVLCISCTSMSYGLNYNHVSGEESRYGINYDYLNHQFLADFSFGWKYFDLDMGLGLSYVVIDNESKPDFSFTGGYLGLVPGEIAAGLKYPLKIGNFAIYPKIATAMNLQLITGSSEMTLADDVILLKGGLGLMYYYNKRGFIKIEGLYNYAIASPGRGFSIICHLGTDLK